jgi:hypothetical protein
MLSKEWRKLEASIRRSGEGSSFCTEEEEEMPSAVIALCLKYSPSYLPSLSLRLPSIPHTPPPWFARVGRFN